MLSKKLLEGSSFLCGRNIIAYVIAIPVRRLANPYSFYNYRQQGTNVVSFNQVRQEAVSTLSERRCCLCLVYCVCSFRSGKMLNL